jgi:hypothetical protein
LVQDAESAEHQGEQEDREERVRQGSEGGHDQGEGGGQQAHLQEVVAPDYTGMRRNATSSS